MRRTEPLAPFRIVALGGVRGEPWLLAESREALGERAEHWDPDLTLRLDRVVTVDLGAVLTSTGLASPDRLALTTVWRSDRTRLRGSGMSVPLRDRSGEAQVSLSLDIPGHLAGGSVELRTALVLTEDWEEASPLVAKRIGAVLWSDRVAVALEGSAARFPVTVLDFADVPGLAETAPWALEWSPRDLDQPVLGAMRLLVNSAVPVVVAAISGGGDPRDVAIAALIRFDVARSLVHGALSQKTFAQGTGEFETDSVGRMLQDLLGRYWPGTATESLARRLADTPHRIESELQAKTGLLVT
jgi:hypothetical protein